MLRGIVSFVVFVCATVVCGSVALVGSLLRRQSDIIMRMGRYWSAANLRAVGARVTYEGLDRMTAVSPCVYIANHESNIDIWALMRILPLHARFVAKQSLFRIPVMGWAMAASGFVPIDRGNRSAAIQSLRRAARRIRDGRSVVLFPEGTRNREGGLREFKKGPFHLAIEARVPIVPVVIHGSGQVLPARSWIPRPGPVRVRVLEPLPVTSYQRGDQLRLLEDVRARMVAELDLADAPPGEVRPADATP